MPGRIRATTRRILTTREDITKHSQPFVLLPRLWDTFARRAPGVTFAWKDVQFLRRNKSLVPQSAGVYAFVIRRHVGNHPQHVYLMYMGSTDNLRRRYGQYLHEEVAGENREDVIWMLNTYSRRLWFTYSIVPSGTEEDLEEKLYTAIWPPINRKGKAIPAMLDRVGRAF